MSKIKLSKLLYITEAIPYPGFVRTASSNHPINQSRLSDFYKYLDTDRFLFWDQLLTFTTLGKTRNMYIFFVVNYGIFFSWCLVRACVA